MTYKAKDFIKAIKGSGGIITTIAKDVGCCWNTAKKYIEGHKTVKDAYRAELETMIDRAEGVVLRNIDFAAELQKKKKKQVDSGDAKWFLSRKGKDRGYVERQEQTGPDGGAIKVKAYVGITPEEWDEEEEDG